jgi:hypothetical protein
MGLDLDWLVLSDFIRRNSDYKALHGLYSLRYDAPDSAPSFSQFLEFVPKLLKPGRIAGVNGEHRFD